MPSFFSEGDTPLRTDTVNRILLKILGAANSGAGGTGVNYAFCGTPPNRTLMLLNRGTGLYNALFSSGADGDQSVGLDPGTAC